MAVHRSLFVVLLLMVLVVLTEVQAASLSSSGDDEDNSGSSISGSSISGSSMEASASRSSGSTDQAKRRKHGCLGVGTDDDEDCDNSGSSSGELSSTEPTSSSKQRRKRDCPGGVADDDEDCGPRDESSGSAAVAIPSARTSATTDYERTQPTSATYTSTAVIALACVCTLLFLLVGVQSVVIIRCCIRSKHYAPGTPATLRKVPGHVRCDRIDLVADSITTATDDEADDYQAVSSKRCNARPIAMGGCGLGNADTASHLHLTDVRQLELALGSQLQQSQSQQLNSNIKRWCRDVEPQPMSEQEKGIIAIPDLSPVLEVSEPLSESSLFMEMWNGSGILV